MKRFGQLKGKFQLILISMIIVLCAGFTFVSCGKKPQLKVNDPSKGAYAIDFTSCPSAFCRILLGSSEFHSDPEKSTEGKEVTIEAWVKSKAASAADFTGGIAGRFDNRGIALYVREGVPKAVIRRVGASGGATAVADYIANSNMTAIADALWHHIAAVLTEDDHRGVHADCTNTTDTVDCTDGAVSCIDDIHLDIYVDGEYKDCNTTYGQDGDVNATGPSFTENAEDEYLGVGVFSENITNPVEYAELNGVVTDEGVGTPAFPGIVDEVRLWGVERSLAEILACKGKELTLDKGTCGRMTSNLIAYMRFNAGEGESAYDWAGTGGSGTMETPPLPGNAAWRHWTTGWTSDTPGLVAD